MPQLTEFPHLSAGEPSQAVSSFIGVCRALPIEGENLKSFRRRLKAAGLWKKEYAPALFRFLRVRMEDPVVPSHFVRQVAGAETEDAARGLIAERLWTTNPILFKTLVEALGERVYPRGDLYRMVDSIAYRGDRVTRVHIEAWLELALGLDIIRRVGVGIGLSERGKAYLERARAFDVDEFLEDDEPEEDVIRAAAAADLGDDGDAGAAAEPSAPAAFAAPASPEPAPVAHDWSQPRGRGRPVATARFAGAEVFPDDVLAESTERLEAWWAEQSPSAGAAHDEDFGFDSEAWMEGAEELLYRIAVAAAMVFRLGGDRRAVRAAWDALDGAGVLGDLYFGTAPEALPQNIDPQALMLASLVARRCAETPDLAKSIEAAESAADAFALLDAALGRGLFKIELFWITRTLERLDVLRFEDLGDYASLPTRLVRDTLYRLGYVSGPYAHDAASLVPAARAARRAAGKATPADSALTAFAIAAGCAYDCPHARRCEYACRERAE